VKWYCGYNP